MRKPTLASVKLNIPNGGYHMAEDKGLQTTIVNRNGDPLLTLYPDAEKALYDWLGNKNGWNMPKAEPTTQQ